jgi:hypothetical protein
MALKNTIIDLVSEAMVLLDDLPETATYSSVIMGTYNVTTGTMSKTLTSRTFSAVKANFSVSEMDESIIPSTDAKLIVAAKDFGVGEPSINDTVTIGTRNWNVENYKGVPGDSVWLIHIRKQ